MKRPVFVVGCPRSGTTLLYSMLVAAGGFAVYRKETYFYDLIRRFPDLSSPSSQQQFAAQFLDGYLGKVPGLDVRPFLETALRQSRSSGEVLPRLMDGITQAQGMDRWIEATPIHVLHLHEIKRVVPNALVVHVIRDGRDCALSNTGQRWVPTLPWDRDRRLGVAALYWEWMLRAGRAYGRVDPADYFELRFEDLIADPRVTLDRLGRFIDHDLDCDRIQQNPVHALKRPNTSFREERDRPDFNPIGRWKDRCSPADLRLCEQLIGPSLEELGYDLTTSADGTGSQVRPRVMRAIYVRHFATKHWLKMHTPLGGLLTSTRIWAEQPKADEALVRPTPSGHAAPVAPDGQLVSR